MSNPYEPPKNFEFGGRATSSSENVEQLIAIAGAQRNVNLALLTYLCSAGLSVISPLLSSLGIIVSLVFSLVAAISLAKALHGTGVAIACAVFMFIPCVNLITLLVLSSGATNRLKDAGINVGFLGTSPDEVRQMFGRW